eukprot:753426-Karenia_brevis.AAC.1
MSKQKVCKRLTELGRALQKGHKIYIKGERPDVYKAAVLAKARSGSKAPVADVAQSPTKPTR